MLTARSMSGPCAVELVAEASWRMAWWGTRETVLILCAVWSLNRATAPTSLLATVWSLRSQKLTTTKTDAAPSGRSSTRH
eukprot:scaffold64473_cov30-Tisochrysis_lutea.AAC.3